MELVYKRNHEEMFSLAEKHGWKRWVSLPKRKVVHINVLGGVINTFGLVMHLFKIRYMVMHYHINGKQLLMRK